MRTYQTQALTAAPAETWYLWRCHACGRLIGRIERIDGVIEVRHRCGAMNRLSAVLPALDADADHE